MNKIKFAALAAAMVGVISCSKKDAVNRVTIEDGHGLDSSFVAFSYAGNLQGLQIKGQISAYDGNGKKLGFYEITTAQTFAAGVVDFNKIEGLYQKYYSFNPNISTKLQGLNRCKKFEVSLSYLGTMKDKSTVIGVNANFENGIDTAVLLNYNLSSTSFVLENRNF